MSFDITFGSVARSGRDLYNMLQDMTESDIDAARALISEYEALVTSYNTKYAIQSPNEGVHYLMLLRLKDKFERRVEHLK